MLPITWYQQHGQIGRIVCGRAHTHTRARMCSHADVVCVHYGTLSIIMSSCNVFVDQNEHFMLKVNLWPRYM